MNNPRKLLPTIVIMTLAAFMAIFVSCGGKSSSTATPQGYEPSSVEKADSTRSVSDSKANQPDSGYATPLGARAIIEAYPQSVTGYEDGAIVMADGVKITYDDGKEKDHLSRLDNADIEDMFHDIYPLDICSHFKEPDYLFDPGRSRCEAFYKQMYGSTQSAVMSHLKHVAWDGGSVKFSSVNDADKQLAKVYEELKNCNELKKYLVCSGTFNWRPVRGSSRLSAHSYGTAIDIAVPYSNFWKWGNKGATETSRIKYKNSIPLKIVEIFQKHGFIWGGCWYHYDTMHFEFRPEILRYAELAH